MSSVPIQLVAGSFLPGWKAEKTPTGFMMISPKMAMDRRRAENDDCPEEGVCLPGQQ